MTESLPAPLLPLTPFETLMWRDDRPGYPMVFAVKVELRGELRREAFITAARQAVERHPLLHSIVVRSQGRDCWRQLPSAAPEIVWLAEQTAVPAELWQGLDIKRRGGLRLIVQPTSQGSRLLLQYHHACTDGVGGLNYFGDLLGYYHAALTGHLPRELSKPAETELLTQRGTLFPPEATSPVEQPPPASWWKSTISTLRDSWNFATYRAAAIAPLRNPHSAATSEGDDNAPYVTRFLPAEATKQLRQLAVARDAQLNDVLLRDLFLTIDAWNASEVPALLNRPMRMGMPVNMRTELHRRSPAANILSYGFLHRTRAERADADALLKSIAGETHLIQSARLGNLLLSGLAWVPSKPWLLGWLLRLPGTFATAMLSNVGDPTRRMRCKLPRVDGRLSAGNLVVESMTGTPPVRPGTHVSMAVMLYADEITFMAMGCPRKFGPPALALFMDRYLAQLALTAAQAASLPIPDQAHTAVANSESL